MGSYCELYISGCEVFSSKSHVIPEVMTIFRESDKIIQTKTVIEDEEQSEETIVAYQASAKVIKERLDVMGFTLKNVLTDFDYHRSEKVRELSEYVSDDTNDFWQEELDLFKENSFENYLDAFKQIISSGIHPVYYLQENPNSSKLIQSILSDYNEGYHWGFPSSEIRYFFRAIIEVVSEDSFVRQDISDLVANGYYHKDERICENALNNLIAAYPSNSNIIILTEGKTDKEVLEQSLKLLYPHLFEYYSFMDFSFLPPGGAGNLVNLIKSFSGAKITNNVIAIFDNDTAAFSAVLSLKNINLPHNIKVLHYPDIELANDYPTIGPSGKLNQNINGFACSIELYFGEDVLARNGEFTPVHWRNFDDRIERYQGVIQNKNELKQKFLSKLDNCKINPSGIIQNEWKEIDEILKAIFEATYV